MAENKTKPTRVDPKAFIEQVENERRRKDATELLGLMQALTGEPAVMWGPTIVGFGRYHYRYESGREGDIMLLGFAPRKQNLVLYVGAALDDTTLMSALGKHKRSKGCLYINKLDDIDRRVLRKLLEKSLRETRKRIA
jgi:Domain of unknown function (DU1801)